MNKSASKLVIVHVNLKQIKYLENLSIKSSILGAALHLAVIHN